MADALVAIGLIGQLVVWRSVAWGRIPFWPATAATFTVLGFAALAAGDVAWSASVSAGAAAAVGIASGIGLYAATRVVVALAARHTAIGGSVADVYERSDEVPRALALVLTMAIAVPGEELFFRGLVLPQLQDATSPLAGAALAWLAGVGVNAAWASLPFLAGAVVGGGLWTALGAWSGGILAPLLSHLVWTGSMLAWPPRMARAKVGP
jgi:hypothetical protein